MVLTVHVRAILATWKGVSLGMLQSGTSTHVARRAILSLHVSTRMAMALVRIPTQSQTRSVGWASILIQQRQTGIKQFFSITLTLSDDSAHRECSKRPCDTEYPEYGDEPPADRSLCCSPGSSGATCGDKNGLGASPNPNPVTDDDCGDGWVANPAMSGR